MGILVAMSSLLLLTFLLYKRYRFNVYRLFSESSFFVYALHMIIIRDVGNVIMRALCLPDAPGSMLLFYFIVPLFTVLLCITIYSIMKKYVPGFLNLLTGGR